MAFTPVSCRMNLVASLIDVPWTTGSIHERNAACTAHKVAQLSTNIIVHAWGEKRKAQNTRGNLRRLPANGAWITETVLLKEERRGGEGRDREREKEGDTVTQLRF